MSFRSILMGLLLALLVAVGGHFNDVYMQQTYMVGNFFPISVIGLLILFVLVINPLLFRIRPKWKLGLAELAVIVALPLIASVVPGSGFLRTFTPVMALPHHYEQMDTSWQQNEVMSYVPEGLLAGHEDVSEDDFLGSFLQGKGGVDHHIRLRDVPWKAWMPCLQRWVPLFFIMMIGLMGLSLVLHRQWTTHEHLVYPVAEFVQLITKSDTESPLPTVTRNRLFWYGFAVIALIHLVNGLHAWFPAFIEIPHRIDLSPVRELFPRLAVAHGARFIFEAQIYFAVVAFAFFLPSEITLSLGLSNFLAGPVSAAFITYGVAVTNVWIGDGETQGLLFGAYVGMGLMIIYTGRKYFSQVFLRALGSRSKAGAVESSAVWGARIFLLAGAACVVTMHLMGLNWPLAAFIFLLFTTLFTVMSRICAETGLFFIQPGWQAAGVMLGLLGASAMGPRMLTVSILLCLVITIDPRECLMPFIVNALRIAENAKVPRGRLTALMGGTLAIGLVAGLVMVLWLQYDRGVGLNYRWATSSVPTMGFNLLKTKIQLLNTEGVLEESIAQSGWDRIRSIRPKRSFMIFMGSGFLLFTACALLRLRFSKWPLHPVLFLVWFTYPLMQFAWSFLIGWMIKSMVVKFGGGSTYQRVKPLMVGVIAGEMTVGLAFIVVGAVYYFVTGFPPKNFVIFPG